MAPVFWSLLSDQPCNPSGRTVWHPGRMKRVRLNRLLCGHKACIYSVFEQQCLSAPGRGWRVADGDGTLTRSRLPVRAIRSANGGAPGSPKLYVRIQRNLCKNRQQEGT